jgi:NitT/TauT family transport system substrate-binding protein
MPIMQTRRGFLTTVSLAGAAGLLRAPLLHAAEGALETTTVRLTKGSASICGAPKRIAGELLRAEGFTDIHYLPEPALDTTEAVGSGAFDFAMNFASSLTAAIDRGVAVTALAGIHVGCFGLFGHAGIRGISDLKGKSVAVLELRGPAHLFVAAMAAHVGIDPGKDINWVPASPGLKAMELFAEGKTDAFLGLPPQPQELRARHIGHLVVDSAVDRPWSQYFCCMLYGNSDYVQKHPVATKRVVRAILKAADLCAAQPERVARQLVDDGLTEPYDRVLEVIRELPYDKWREYDPEDTMRFYALRLHEAGLIKSSPQKIIAEGTDWRFLNELKRELKA